MLITTLGTSHGDHTYCRFNSSTLIESQWRTYLIDAGAPVNGLLVRAGKDVHEIKAVFITHMHDDHVGGLSGLIKSLIKRPNMGQKTDIFLPEPNADTALIDWLAAQHLRILDGMISFKCIPSIETSVIYSDGVLQVTRIPTAHLGRSDGNAASFAFSLELESKKILYSGDLRGDFSDFPIIAEPYDLCICEATHYDPTVALPVLRNCNFKRLIFNHIHNPWHGDGERVLMDHYASLPYPVEIAHDGDCFIV